MIYLDIFILLVIVKCIFWTRILTPCISKTTHVEINPFSYFNVSNLPHNLKLPCIFREREERVLYFPLTNFQFSKRAYRFDANNHTMHTHYNIMYLTHLHCKQPLFCDDIHCWVNWILDSGSSSREGYDVYNQHLT